MSKKYELAWPERISSDTAVDKFLHEGTVDIESPSIADLQTAIEWLAFYAAETQGEAQPFANVIGFLDRAIQGKRKRASTTDLKRRYAAAHQIDIANVRIKH